MQKSKKISIFQNGWKTDRLWHGSSDSLLNGRYYKMMVVFLVPQLGGLFGEGKILCTCRTVSSCHLLPLSQMAFINSHLCRAIHFRGQNLCNITIDVSSLLPCWLHLFAEVIGMQGLLTPTWAHTYIPAHRVCPSATWIEEAACSWAFPFYQVFGYMPGGFIFFF